MNDEQKRATATLPAIADAVRTAFGDVPSPELELLHGGLSTSSVFKLVVEGRPFVLRHINGGGPSNDVARQFTCMRIAAERGLAPPVVYANAERGVCITAFIQGTTLGPLLRSGSPPIDSLAEMLRRLHDGPAFPPFVTVADAIFGIHEQLFQHVPAPAFMSELLPRVAEIREVLAPHARMVACHNDLNPNNILHDGQRFWLVDWETAGAGDAYQDLASIGVYALPDERHRARLLDAYLGRTPDAQEQARMRLSRIVALAFNATGLFTMAMLRNAPLELVPREQLPDVGAALRQDSPVRRPAWFAQVLAAAAQREIAAPEYGAALSLLR